MADLFDSAPEPPRREDIAPGAALLRGFARGEDRALIEAIDAVVARAPFRHMVTPGGHAMSVAMTSCGSAGWVTDRRGYRYASDDPDSAQPWPQMPPVLRDLAQRAAAEAGFAGFDPDACLINRYVPGAKMALHQDKDERDFSAPIVSVSLGLPATFQFGGLARSDKPRRYELRHGDVFVWGGPTRLVYHGVLTLKDGEHPLLGRQRINLTFRKAL
ncbi:DNA oxidative demethylase AlkB [Rhodopseudomonas palustris]|uniref:Alpha-ketoglutarate-dependent dioxygenase AlkB n=1 Tax=Rhodopseudomonas palustris TaxID=1076 RepID=A0A418VH18_RHOPL|nr:DNA oxidative demethylase AlkB [Rhodopseudomonas palustris]RJF75423.1 DNA oxidative demethylase AlkB [Rhodopseudomonas palustris]